MAADNNLPVVGSSSVAHDEAPLTEEQRRRLEEYMEEEEGALNRYRGVLAVLMTAAAVVMSLFHLYAAIEIVPAYILRPVHVAFALALVFLLFPAAKRFRHRLMWFDVILALVSVGIIAYILYWGDELGDRATVPTSLDVVVGVALIVLILEGNRRSSTWILPFICLLFIGYALFGPYLPPPWTHKGYEIDRLVGSLYMTLEGIFGTAVDVSSTLIILFTIYGAVLQYSGAGKFFIDFSFAAMGGKPSSAGRAIVLGSFLLGGPSGSGVATTVTLGSVGWPLLQRSGYGKEAAGGLLAAGGLGAILSPPVLGAAAFLIAEFLKISYLDVILMATIPTILFYLAIFIMVEIDARKFHMATVVLDKHERALTLARKYWYHFVSLIAIVIFMLWGYSPVLAVFWATLTTAVLSFFRRDTAIIPYEWFQGRLPWLRGFWVRVSSKHSKAAPRHAQRGDDVRVGRHHRRRRHADRTRAQVQLDRARLRGVWCAKPRHLVELFRCRAHATAAARHAIAADRDLHVSDRVDCRPGGAGYGVLHHLCRDRRARADQARRTRLRCAHVHLLLRGALGSVAAHGTFAFRGCSDHRGGPYRTTLQCWKYTTPAFLVPFMFVLDPSGVGCCSAARSRTWRRRTGLRLRA
jgi:TRAP-type uncharacterized transport system fused permease subunit